MTDRYETLRKYPIAWPAMDALFFLWVLRLAMLIVAAAGLYWLVFGVLTAQRPESQPERPRQA